MANIRASAVIAAAGQGKRFGDGPPKQFLPLRGKPVLAYSVETFSKSDFIGEIIIVVPDDWARTVKTDIVDRLSIPKVTKIIPGGPERQDSVLIGLSSLSNRKSVV